MQTCGEEKGVLQLFAAQFGKIAHRALVQAKFSKAA
jgi:hypothetical protein